MPNPVRLISLATVVPRHVLRQEEVAACAHSLFRDGAGDIDRLAPVYGNAGIETRYSCMPIEWYGRPCGWAERNRLFVHHAVRLLRRAAARALDQAGIAAEQVDSIVVASTSGIATPSLDARLMETLPLRRDIQRLPIFGLGCAGGVLGLARAAAMARAAPGSIVLFLVVELCGLTFRNRDSSKSNIVATALFGDGAAAAVLSSRRGGPGPEIAGWGEYTWPDTLDVMGWRVEEYGLGVRFSRAIPGLVRARFGAAVDRFLAAHGLVRGDLDGTICHPGGAKVLDALENVFGLPPGGMSDARAVLKAYGNMSAATVMFVLARNRRRQARGRYLISALGPGFSVGFALLESP